MEWVLYLVSNLNGDASFLSIPAPSNYQMPQEDPPDVDAVAPDHHAHHHTAQVAEEVIFDGNLDDLQQVVVVEQDDLAEVEQKHAELQNMVISLVTTHNYGGEQLNTSFQQV